MNKMLRKPEGDLLPAFVPPAGDEPRTSGKRRSFEKVEALPLKWPPAVKERYDLFDAWHDVAMQILHQEKGSFRLIAIAKKVIRWRDGVICGSNADLALRAGCCAEKTISRDVQDYIDLGILIGSLHWKRPGGDKFITVRTLRPALPTALPEGIILPETVPLSLDNSGPDLAGLSLANSGPGGLDNSGPATIHYKNGGIDAA